MTRHTLFGKCNCDVCSGAPAMRLAISQSLLDADGEQPTLMELNDRERAAAPIMAEKLDRLEQTIVEVRAERDRERTTRVRVEGQLARMQVEVATRIDLDAALRDVKYERELSHEKLVAALREAPDLSGLVGTVRDALDRELADCDGPWEDLAERERGRVAGRIIRAIAADLADAKT